MRVSDNGCDLQGNKQAERIILQIAFLKYVFWPVESDFINFFLLMLVREMGLGFPVSFTISCRVGNIGKLKSMLYPGLVLSLLGYFLEKL